VIATLERYLPDLVILGTAISLFSLLAVLLAVPWAVARLPQDYFTDPRDEFLHFVPGPAGMLLVILKNLLGLLLAVLGFIMLFTPGQGLLTLLAGLLLMDFPGKYRLECALARRRKVLEALNWMRRRRGLPPFDPPAD